jgi:hypothetical protein
MNRPEEEIILRWPGGFAAQVPVDMWETQRCCGGHATPREALKHAVSIFRSRLTISEAAWRAGS